VVDRASGTLVCVNLSIVVWLTSIVANEHFFFFFFYWILLFYCVDCWGGVVRRIVGDVVIYGFGLVVVLWDMLYILLSILCGAAILDTMSRGSCLETICLLSGPGGDVAGNERIDFVGLVVR